MLDAAERRDAHAGQPTPAHIVSAINLIADYCDQHGYPCVVVGSQGGAVFRATSVLDDLHVAHGAAAQMHEALGLALTGAPDLTAWDVESLPAGYWQNIKKAMIAYEEGKSDE